MLAGVEICLSWVDAADGEIPRGAVSVGGDVFVGRFLHKDQMLPGKVIKRQGACLAPYGGREEISSKYQVLCETPINFGEPRSDPGYQWSEPWSGHTAPDNALISGSDQGKPLYVARANVNGEWCSGKYLPEYGRAYVSYDGSEHEVHSGFEVLFLRGFYNFTSASGRGVDICVSWVDADVGEIHPEAVGAGSDNLVVTRFLRNRKMRLGGVGTTRHLQFNCTAPNGGGHQVLRKTPNTGLKSQDPDYQWVAHSGHSDVPNNAIIGGISHDKPQYVARAKVSETWYTGKYLPHKGRAYVYHGTKKRELPNQFEILVLTGKNG